MRFSLLRTALTLLAASRLAAAERKGEVIPVSMWGCTGKTLNGSDVKVALKEAVKWGKHWRVMPREVEWWDGDEATWWICNCKIFDSDPVVDNELWDVLDILEQECGTRYQSGWVWSKRWNKGFNLATIDDRRSVDDGDHDDLCPRGCLSVQYEDYHLQAKATPAPEPAS